ncbi:hypothetical protein CVD28_07940 [Bacillus sp. M6-12]|uniref:FixH family protein n=1 Tax=Bacillus sp. M6-12 TaxID=2054166 RepID=UPI000C78764A|nr:FixH family protein [Bacillus sp. M6-12]PLS18211.1 hypothetical protein CVD28_07940 [Bacillus sp. M6-12]
MKKTMIFSLVIIFTLILNACTLKQDVAQLYKEEKPLQIEIITPENFSSDHIGTVKAILTQDGKPIENPDFVHFEIWKQDGSVNYGMEEANEEGKGTYSMNKSFKSEGLYFIKVHASSNGSIIMPQKQFIVGKLTESDKEFLKNQTQLEQKSHGGHH